MNNRRTLNRKGVTLIEFLVVLVIFGVVVAGIYRVFIAQTKAYTIQDQVVETQQNVRGGMEILLRDLRMAGFNGDNTPYTPSITPGANSIDIYYFHNGNMRKTTYSVNGGTLMRNQVPPEIPPAEAGGDPILTNVNALNFSYGIDTNENGTVASWVQAGSVGTSKIIAVQVTLAASPTSTNPDLKSVSPRTLQSTVALRNLCLR